MAVVGIGFGMGRKPPVALPGRPCGLMFAKASALCNFKVTKRPVALCNFKVTKRPPVVVTPNRPTPSHRLYLTNIDDQMVLRIHVNLLLFYRSSSKKNEDPVHIIEEALAKLLVHYYPFAGRLRDADDKGKLVMDCTGEGVLLVEADADLSLEDFGILSSPIPRAFDFISNVPGSDTITDSPLLVFQITRLRCGGFILSLRFNHCVTDGVGITQFMNALGETARGAARPAVPPVWSREILRPREKPTANFTGLSEYEVLEESNPEPMQVHAVAEEMKSKSFYFGSKEIASLKRQVEGVKQPTPFEIISACMWRSTTKALGIPGDQDSTILFPFNARSRFRPPIPTGYYGNVIVPAYATAKSRDLTQQPLSLAVKLINEGKRRVTEEYVRSIIDLAELNGHPQSLCTHGSYNISDVSNIMLDLAETDFGWGKAAYACPVYPPLLSISYLTRPPVDDFEGFLVPASLPSIAMEILEQDINNTIKDGLQP